MKKECKNFIRRFTTCLLAAVVCLNMVKIPYVKATEPGNQEQQTGQEENTEENLSESNTEESESIETEQDQDTSDESAPGIENVEDDETSENTETQNAEEEDTDIIDTDETYFRYTTERFEVEYRIDAQWEGHYNASVIIYNTGGSVIDNWCISFQSQDGIENIYNAVILEHQEDHYMIKNAQYNQDIEAGGSISFGFTASYRDRIQIPKFYELMSEEAEVDEEGIQVSYEIVNDWGSGFVGKIRIKNNTDSVLEDWGLEFDFDNSVDGFWTANIVSKEASHYMIKNAGYNANVAAGSEVEIGFNCSNGDAQKEPENFKLTSSTIKSEEAPKPDREPEPLADIGEIYFKDIESENDIVTDSESGMIYVRNQILVSALEGLDKDFFENVVADIGAHIVGYIELTNDYQIEFTQDRTKEELESYIQYLESLSFIESAGFNFVIGIQPDMTTTNDLVYKEGQDTWDGIWDEDAPDGYNWGLEALRVPSAWDYVTHSNPVKMGIIDIGFDENHEDLRFEKIFGNNDSGSKSHGTACAGLMAAEHDNGIGISGVATDVRLYAYAVGDQYRNSMMEYKVAFAYLAGNRVKVINVSLGYDDELVFGASRENANARIAAFWNSNVINDFLWKLYTKGYDFVIVNAAGNGEDLHFVEDDSIYGYSQIDDGSLYGNVLAEYNSMFSWIKDPVWTKRIIVVGATDRFVYYSSGKKVVNHKCASFSNTGSRVDVCAPGKEIVTLCSATDVSNIGVSGYAISQGTSLAAPYIAGLAGLMYQVNPGLDVSQVKEILLQNSDVTVSDRHGNEYKMPDAPKCIQSALAASGGTTDTILPNGFLIGTIVNKKGEKLSKARITACRTDTGESNLDDYCISDSMNLFGSYEFVLAGGTYDLIVSCEGYLPCVVKDVHINPDETTYMETVVMNTSIWSDFNSKMEGRVANALNDNHIAGATVRFRTGWNNKTGSYITDRSGTEIKCVTDSAGNFSVDLPIGSYTIEISKSGFVTGYFNAVSSSGKSNLEQKYVLTPVLSEDEYRIVLTWGKEPEDLDSHLMYYENGYKKMHVYYRNECYAVDGKKIAVLDFDDTTSYGPETITLTVTPEFLENGKFSYFVHDFSNSGSYNITAMSFSDAVVRVYRGNEQVEIFSIPQNRSGTVWHVFDISDHGIEAVNEIGNTLN